MFHRKPCRVLLWVAPWIDAQEPEKRKERVLGEMDNSLKIESGFEGIESLNGLDLGLF